MALTAEQFNKHFNNVKDAQLKLFNTQGEWHDAGEVTTYIHLKNAVKLRWEISPMSNVFPFTHGAISSRGKVVNIFAIKPLDPGIEGTEVELKYDY